MIGPSARSHKGAPQVSTNASATDAHPSTATRVSRSANRGASDGPSHFKSRPRPPPSTRGPPWPPRGVAGRGGETEPPPPPGSGGPLGTGRGWSPPASGGFTGPVSQSTQLYVSVPCPPSSRYLMREQVSCTQ